ncbi:MAG: hypothetical protein AABY22_03100 [Nanoarchaeota archaeon]
MKKLKKYEKTYLAAALDSEGWMSWSISPSRHKYPQIQFCNTNLDFVKKVANLLDSTNFSERNRKGSLGKKTCYCVSLNKGKEVLNLLKQIEPYLIVKKERANLLLSILRKRFKNGKKK